MVALYALHYNYCRIHSTLKVTPAMEAGLINGHATRLGMDSGADRCECADAEEAGA